MIRQGTRCCLEQCESQKHRILEQFLQIYIRLTYINDQHFKLLEYNQQGHQTVEGHKCYYTIRRE